MPPEPDAAPSAWHASTPWVDERPRALAVCCSDGRWHEQIEEFIRADIGSRADVLAIPGGVAMFDPWRASFEEARAADLAVRFLLRHHAIESAWLISHESCAWYRDRHPFDSPPVLLQRQVSDLRAARTAILRHEPRLRVHLWHAALDGATVALRRVGDE